MGHSASKQGEEACAGSFMPRSAHRSCDLPAVQDLISSQRLAPCFQPIDGAQGHECPVCMEDYCQLNHTDCCHQDICTECFISIVADTGAHRCPYCQAGSLQVYLPCDASRQAARAPTPATSLCPHSKQPQATLPANRGLFGAKGPSSPAKQLLVLLPASTSTLADAAAGTNLRRGSPIIAMVFTQEPAPPIHDSSNTTSSRNGSSAASSTPAAPATGVAPENSPTGPAGLPSPAGGPALLLNPDGTAQLVLLSSGESEEEAAPAAQPDQTALPSYQAPATLEDERIRAAIARGDSAFTRQQPAARPAAASAPATNSNAAPASDDWLARMQAADEALRLAVARNDSQRIGGGAP